MLSREEQILSELLVRRRLAEPADIERIMRGREPGEDLVVTLERVVGVSSHDVSEVRDEARVLAALDGVQLGPGARLDEFRIIREIGRGGMGIVFEAVQESLDRRVALKVLPIGIGLDAPGIVRFLRESRVTSRLDHPGIARVYSCGQTDHALYFAMELIDGRDLSQVREWWQPRAAAAIAAQVARALAHAHDKGLVHRDIKPANILIDGAGRARVVDFGLVRDAASDGITVTSTILGTPAFMAPEQAAGRDVSPASDVYSVGAVLYYMLSGRAPFVGESARRVLASVLTTMPPPLRDVAPDVPSALVAIVERAMAREPDRRHASAIELANALDDVSWWTEESGRLQTPRARPSPRALLLMVALLGVVVMAVWWRVRSPTLDPHAAQSSTGVTARLTMHDVAHHGILAAMSPTGDRLYTVDMSGGSPTVWSHETASRAVESWTPGCGLGLSLSSDGAWAGCTYGEHVDLIAAGTRERRRIELRHDDLRHPLRFALPASDGREVLVVGALERLWRGTLAHEELLPLTSLAIREVCWSPDQRHAAFTATSGGRFDLFTIAIDGGEIRRLSDDDGLEFSPVWLADGNLYYGHEIDGRFSLNRRRVEVASDAGGTAAESVTTQPFLARFSLAGAASGGRLALSYGEGAVAERAARVAFDPIRGSAQSPTPVLIPFNEVPRTAVSSSDGRLILELAPRGDLGIVDGDGERVIAREPFVDRAPSWSGDGRLIAFQSDRSGHDEIWTVQPDGSGLTRRSQTDGRAEDPIWSPDDRQIALTVGGIGAALIDANVVAGTPRRLPPMPNGQMFAARSWSPDGSSLAGEADGVYLYTFSTRSYTRVTSDGESPVWLPDSRRLVYVLDDSVRLVDTGSREEREILSLSIHHLRAPLALSPSGDQLYFTVASRLDQVVIIDIDQP